MAGDLMIVALHDLTIEQLAIKIARRRGHRAIYQARVQIDGAGDIQLSSRAGMVTIVSCQGLPPNNVVTSWWDGTPESGRILFVTTVDTYSKQPTTLTPPGVLVTAGLWANVRTNTGGPWYLFAQWSEVCQCHLGHDHPGSMGG